MSVQIGSLIHTSIAWSKWETFDCGQVNIRKSSLLWWNKEENKVYIQAYMDKDRWSTCALTNRKNFPTKMDYSNSWLALNWQWNRVYYHIIYRKVQLAFWLPNMIPVKLVWRKAYISGFIISMIGQWRCKGIARLSFSSPSNIDVLDANTIWHHKLANPNRHF